jgi:hypothetical protein
MEKLELGTVSVVIDPEHLNFNETTLNDYIQTESGYYDNFGAYLALAEKMLQQAELRAESVFSQKLADWKDANGGSDKMAESRAKADPERVAAENEVIEAKYKVKRLQQHLKAWDKNHDNAQSLGHMLRKEMDKLQSDIFVRNRRLDVDIDRKVEETVKSFDEYEDE